MKITDVLLFKYIVMYVKSCYTISSQEPENTRFCVNPEIKNNLLNNELPTDKLTTEIVPERHREKESQLAESITEFLMEELIEEEISGKEVSTCRNCNFTTWKYQFLFFFSLSRCAASLQILISLGNKDR